MTSSGSDPKPYVGLRPFRREDRATFFGRDREAAELAARWCDNRLTILHGPPGVGKTSLLAAGVLPRLDDGPVLPVGSVLRPLSVPAGLIPVDSDSRVFSLLSSWSPHEIPTEFSGLTVAAYLRRYHWSPEGRPVMAAIDHAEEVFGSGPVDQAHLLDQLADALDGRLPLRLLIVISDEHLAPLLDHAGLRGHVTRSTLYPLGPLNVSSALHACRRPLDGLGREFEPGAAEELVDDLRVTLSARLPTVEPVHLQAVCSTLWEKVRGWSRPITSADLVDSDQVLTDFCHGRIVEVAHDHLHGDVDKLIALLRQIAVGDGTDGGDLPAPVVRVLAERHVLRLGPDGLYRVPGRLVRPFLRGRFRKREEEQPAAADQLHAARHALHHGLFELAAKHAGEAMRHSAGDARLRARIESFSGDMAYLRDDLDEALVHYRRAAQMFDTINGAQQTVATLLTAIGRILMSQGQFDSAIGELNGAVRRSPDKSVIQTELAWALWYRGKESGAVDVLDSALARKGDSPEALRARGEILSDLERPQPALLDLDRVPHERPSTRAAYALALALSGNVSKAVRAIPPLDRESDGPTLLRAARVMEAAGNRPEAVRLARRARQSTGRRPLPPQLAAEADRLIRS
ncbi:tetratricopeptide repeat protein [Nonomuraea sp. LPB2021202275-12-8]|uniref:tetratricopeptide repeat protein n=1 Tax=Nonomuraea sp. LPB2021202275-12-8 TaxID=3120159 RepID=UPI00300CBA56